ncbi:alpha-N-acetylneuraminide alpha-2,8-sialyltransferase-like isoform X2 [Antedon mediterranea]|uniref:alpha-N-acetylneuraminide alpha-2,8-sialyltransferase-like isoform X2 n=1 Tax=Antedon mediterranea TaxID=105859 RepID=UPI003AF53DFA
MARCLKKSRDIRNGFILIGVIIIVYKVAMNQKRMYGTNYNDPNITDAMFASQENLKPKQKIPYVFLKQRLHTLTGKLHSQLIKKLPFKKRYSSCSVVGNSGIILNSSCGKAIDQAEFVFRFNAPPIKPFTNDAGRKTNLTTVNGSLIRKRFRQISDENGTTENGYKFMDYLMQYDRAYFLFPGFHEGGSTKLCFGAANLLSKNATLADRSLFMRPDNYLAVARFWNITSVLSSGFFVVNAALSMCDNVNLYGFWPFYNDYHNRSLPYHYFEIMKMTKKTHHFGEEFQILSDLHRKGVLKMNFDTCV